MTEQTALQKYIDGKIPPAMQDNYRDAVSLIKGGWNAAMHFARGGLPPCLPNLAPLTVMEEARKEGLIEFENRIKAIWEQGDLPFLVHLCGGNETQLIQIFRDIKPGDFIFSGHRSHYHYLLAGGSPEKLEEKIRRGDSMFVFDRELNFFTSSVLASTCCIAAGVAWQIKEQMASKVDGHQSDPPRVWCFLGDGAEDEGHFYEAVTFVQGNQLPCTFIIEDNDRSVDTSKARRGRHVIAWPSCVYRYSYTPTYPHAGSGCKHTIRFNPAIRPS